METGLDVFRILLKMYVFLLLTFLVSLNGVSNIIDLQLFSFSFFFSNRKPNALKQKNAFPPNFIHSLDSTHMMLTALYCMKWVSCLLSSPFPAYVANKQHLDSAPKSHFCDLRRKTEVIGLFDLMTLFIDLGCLYCKQTQRAFNVFKSTLNWLKFDSVDQKLFEVQLTRVWELLTRHWNSWHWKRNCVFTAGGERVILALHFSLWHLSFIFWSEPVAEWLARSSPMRENRVQARAGARIFSLVWDAQLLGAGDAHVVRMGR
jgi:hypothetical protein